MDLSRPRSASLTLRGRNLDSTDCESLEDVLKNVPLKLLDLGDSHSSDDVYIHLLCIGFSFHVMANKSMLFSLGTNCIVRHDRVLRSCHARKHRVQQKYDQQGMASVLSHDKKGIEKKAILVLVSTTHCFFSFYRPSVWNGWTQLK